MENADSRFTIFSCHSPDVIAIKLVSIILDLLAETKNVLKSK